MHFMKISGMTGAGKHDVSEIKILDKTRNTAADNSYLVVIGVTGTNHSPALAQKTPSEGFSDTLKFEFTKNQHGNWVGKNIPKHLWE